MCTYKCVHVCVVCVCVCVCMCVQLSRMEREGYYEKEQSYLEKVSSMASQIADLKSSNGGTYIQYTCIMHDNII